MPLNHHQAQELGQLPGQPLDQVLEPVSDPALNQALATLADGDFYERWQAIGQLKAIGKPAIPVLVALLTDEALDLEQCWFVARALGEFDDPAAVQSLVNLLSIASDPSVQAAAIEALGKLAERSPPLRTVALDCLNPYLMDPNWGPLVIKAIAQIDHPEAIKGLLIGISAPQPSLRRAALEALGSLPHPALLPHLLKGTQDSEADVRLVAVTALGAKRWGHNQVAQDTIAQTLTQLLSDPVDSVAEAAALALSHWGHEPARAALVAAWERRQLPPELVVRLLAQMGLPSALAALGERLPQGETDLLLGGIVAIAQHHSSDQTYQRRVANLLLDWLDRPLAPFTDWAVQGALIEALGNLRVAAAFDRLLPRLCDRPNQSPTLALQVLAALRQIDPQQGVDRLAAWIDQVAAQQATVTARQGLQEWQAIAQAAQDGATMPFA
ncbi:MAG: HEAT repeat domain-containing protein [Limnothrix sp. BL-A-16]